MYIIGIIGGTASGKTTFVNLLKQQINLNEVTIISQDDYYKPISGMSIAEKEILNFDHPNSLDFELLHEHILKLKQNTSIQRPTYSFETHNRLAKTVVLQPKKILILEGILILSTDKIKFLCDFTLFIDAPEQIRFERRLLRDTQERGRTKDSVLKQFKENIAPMHQQFIEPLKSTVDLVIDGTQSFEEALKKISGLIAKKVSLHQ